MFLWLCLALCFVPAVSGGGPSNVVVSVGTADSLLVSWVPPNAHVLQYRVSYTALTGAEHQDRTVSGLFYWLFFILPVHVYYLCHHLNKHFAWSLTLVRWLLFTGFCPRWWKPGAAPVITARYTLQCHGHCRVPQQRRRKCFSSGKNQWVRRTKRTHNFLKKWKKHFTPDFASTTKWIWHKTIKIRRLKSI